MQCRLEEASHASIKEKGDRMAAFFTLVLARSSRLGSLGVRVEATVEGLALSGQIL